MSFLVDEKLHEIGEELLYPFDPENIGPASVDLTLGSVRYSYGKDVIVLGEELESEREEHFLKYNLKKGKTIFVGIGERISMPRNCVGMIVARSSLARLGVTVSTVYVNPGYSGILPLTITNNSDSTVVMLPGVKVAQLLVLKLSDEPQKAYDQRGESKYQDEDVSPSKINKDDNIEDVVSAFFEREFPRLSKGE